MSAFAAPLFAAAALLVVAGIGKILRPPTTQVALRTAGMPGRAWIVRSIGVVEPRRDSS